MTSQLSLCLFCLLSDSTNCSGIGFIHVIDTNNSRRLFMCLVMNVHVLLFCLYQKADCCMLFVFLWCFLMIMYSVVSWLTISTLRNVKSESFLSLIIWIDSGLDARLCLLPDASRTAWRPHTDWRVARVTRSPEIWTWSSIDRRCPMSTKLSPHPGHCT